MIHVHVHVFDLTGPSTAIGRRLTLSISGLLMMVGALLSSASFHSWSVLLLLLLLLYFVCAYIQSFGHLLNTLHGATLNCFMTVRMCMCFPCRLFIIGRGVFGFSKG